MNQIRRKVEKPSRIAKVFKPGKMEWKWWLARIVKAYSLVVAFWGARRLELLLQQFEQKRDNLEYAKEFEQFLVMKGFCEGIKYCIDGKWNEDQDRSFLAFWRDTRLS